MVTSTGNTTLPDDMDELHNSDGHPLRNCSQRQDLADQPQQYPLARQSSILSLTLDEIQNTVCEPGKNFGSMNMDELLTNIWTAEEGNSIVGAVGGGDPNPAGQGLTCNGANGSSSGLYRQSSLTLPAPLSKKTVEEVWSEIHKDRQQPQSSVQEQMPSAARQTTLGEMTLEDFLIKAGVVREGGGYIPCASTQPPLSQQQHLQGQFMMPSASYPMAMSYADPLAGGANGNGLFLPCQFPQQQQGALGLDASAYGTAGKTSNTVGAGAGYGSMGSPVSPVSSDGFGGGAVDSAGVWGMDMAAAGPRSGGRKRGVLEGAVEKVVERRQRRMIKNRESAARSRARKQAYTVELEAELNHLKEENTRLLEEQRRMAAKRKQMLLESMNSRVQAEAQRKRKIMRRCGSCLW